MVCITLQRPSGVKSAVGIAWALAALGFAGCTPDAINGYFTVLPAAAANPSVTATVPDAPATPDAPPPICNPLTGNGSASSSANGGLSATLYYFPASQFSSDPAIEVNGSYPAPFTNPTHFADYLPENNGNASQALPNSVIFNQLYVPTSYFTAGISSPNGTLAGVDGNNLLSYFALDLESTLQMSTDGPGYYQLGIISDDGSLVFVDQQKAISMDKNQSTTLAVSSSAFYLDANTTHSIEVQYFQGPPTELAVTLIWRFFPTLPTSEELSEPLAGMSGGSALCNSLYPSYCSQSAVTGSGIFFDPDTLASDGSAMPRQAWLDLLSTPSSSSNSSTMGTHGGWKVVPQDAFSLGKVNPCAVTH